MALDIEIITAGGGFVEQEQAPAQPFG